MKVVRAIEMTLLLLPCALIAIIFVANLAGQAGLGMIRIGGLYLALGFTISLIWNRDGKPNLELKTLYVVLLAFILVVLGPVVQAAGAARGTP